MAAPAFFVPLAIAGAKIFFKFASKRAAQTFKSNYAKAGSITTKAPPKNATVTTTGSAKGKSVLKDLKSPVTAPSVRARNPNTTTLPKKPASNKGGKAAGAAATAAGATAASTATSRDADKPKSNRATSQGGRSREQVIEKRQEALARKGGASLTRIKKKKTTSGQVTDSQRKSQGAGVAAKKKMTTPTPPPARPKKSNKTTKPTPKPKMYTAIDTTTGKPKPNAPKVTEAERLKQEDAYKQFRTLQTDIIKSKLSEAAKKRNKKKKEMNKGGAALKSVPDGNTGLKKLPTAVRNRMGFMRKGGVAKKK